MLTIEFTIWFMYFTAIYFAVYMFLTYLAKGIGDGKIARLQKYPTVTVTIPAYNEETTIQPTLQSVMDLDYPADKLKVVVVNDCSTDDTKKIIEQFIQNYKGKFSIELINHTVNQGKGKAVNTSLCKTTSEYFVCLDADSFIEPLALHKMLPHIEGKENVASVLPFIRLPKSKGLMYRLQYIEYLVNFFLKKILGTIDCIHVTPGPFGLYKTSILKKVGYFAEDNLTEDLEMALRLQKRQYKIIQLFSTTVYTDPPKTFKAWYFQRNRWYKGTLINMFKYRSLLFNNKYGEFGFFQLPMVVLAALLSIFFAIFVLWNHALQPLLEKIFDLSYIDFDYLLVSKLWLERFSFFDINFMLLYFLGTIIVFAFCWIYLAHRHGKENFYQNGIMNACIYIILYPIILSIVWLGIVADLLMRKIQKW